MSRLVRAAAALLMAALVLVAVPGRVEAKAVAKAVDTQRYVLLMDVSGSMAEPDPTGRVKMEGAKSAALNALDGMSAAALVGLRTYPDAANSCGGGQPQWPFDPPTSTGLRQAIDNLTPGGGTPTAPALRAAADDLIQAGLTDGSTIILVSDGLSNCGGDPCVVAKEISQQGLAVVNTVGFQISAEGQAELDCVAAATGGQSFTAENSDDLRKAIENASTPRLTVTLTSPEPDSTIPPGAIVVITAVVTNESQQRADRVQALLRFLREGDSVDPGVPGPLRTLGNLAPGQQKTLEWQYRAGPDQARKKSSFVVTAVGTNASPARATRTISYANKVDIQNAGDLLGDENSHVVIVGDSFSSGEGAGGYLPGSDASSGHRCHRSRNTYAMNLGYSTTPTIVACSGAVTANVSGGPIQDSQKATQESQLRAMSDPADVVLMTIGGNDVGFASVIKTCFATPSCHDWPRINPELDGGCILKYAAAGAFRSFNRMQVAGHIIASQIDIAKGCPPFLVDYRTSAEAKIAGVGEDLVSTYMDVDSAVNGPLARLRRQGTIAPIIVLAYPNLVPRTTAGRGWCSWGLSAAELKFGEEFTRLLNNKIADSVKRAQAKGIPIYFASDVADALRPNHTLCDLEPHANRLEPGDVFGDLQEQMHPTAEGYSDMTAALVRWSNRPEFKHATPKRSIVELPIFTGPVPVAIRDYRLDPQPTGVGATMLQGEAVTLQGGGFAPGSEVIIDVQSVPRHAGSGTVDPSGAIRIVAVLPSDLPPGVHTFVAQGFAPDGKPLTQFLLVDVRAPFPFVLVGAAGAAVLLMLIGVVGVWRGRRRRLRTRAAART